MAVRHEASARRADFGAGGLEADKFADYLAAPRRSAPSSARSGSDRSAKIGVEKSNPGRGSSLFRPQVEGRIADKPIWRSPPHRSQRKIWFRGGLAAPYGPV